MKENIFPNEKKTTFDLFSIYFFNSILYEAKVVICILKYFISKINFKFFSCMSLWEMYPNLNFKISNFKKRKKKLVQKFIGASVD